MWRRILFCLVTLAVFAAHADSTESCLDPKNIEDNVFLWESLFTKINTIVSETSTLSESQKALTNTLLELKERQEKQETQLTEFIEKSETAFSNLEKRLQQQQSKLSYFMDQYLDSNVEWTTVLRRQDGSVNFYRNWTEYQKGFGNSDGEFFIGLDKLHNLTTLGAPQELLIVLKDFENEKRIAIYDIFQIGNAEEKYALLKLGKYSGDAGDSLSHHKNMKFSTHDEKNDESVNGNCAKSWDGAWWFKFCYESHLFGPYRSEENTTERGISWHAWKDPQYSLKFVEMKIRAKFVNE